MHNDGRQPIAIGHLSDLGDIKRQTEKYIPYYGNSSKNTLHAGPKVEMFTERKVCDVNYMPLPVYYRKKLTCTYVIKVDKTMQNL